MYILIIIYILILLLEGLLNLQPIVEFGDFALTYNLFSLIFLNCVFIGRYIIKPFRLSVRNEIFFYYIGIILTFIPVLLFQRHLLQGGLSLLVQFVLQSNIIIILSKTLQKKSFNYFLNFLSAFAFINCVLVYASYFFPEYLKGLAEIRGYFGYLDQDPERILRAFGIMGDVAPWFLSFFSILALRMKKYALSVFYAGTCILGASIGAAALLLFAIFLFFLLSSKRKFQFIFKSSILVIFFMALLFLINPEIILNISIVKRLTDPNTFESASGAQRLYTYGLALNMISLSPIWGSGYGTFLYNLQASFGYQFFNLEFGDGALSNTNNQFLQVLYEGGIILFLLFLMMIRRILHIFSKYTNWLQTQSKMIEFKKASFIWFFSLVIMNQTAVWMIPSLIWILIVCLIGMTLYINKNNTSYESFTSYGNN